MVRIPKEHISTGSSPISELLTNSRTFSVLYSKTGRCQPFVGPEKKRKQKKERELQFSACEINAFIWELIGLGHLHIQHAEKQIPTFISAANLLLLSLALAQRSPAATHPSRIPPLLSCSFSSLLSPAQVYNDISTGGVFEEGGLDRSHIFLTIHDAVLFALASFREVVYPPILEEVNFCFPGCVSTKQE